MNDLDEVDRAFVDTLVPDGAMGVELTAVVCYMDPEGIQRFVVYSKPDRNVSSVIAALEVGKSQMMVDFIRRDD